MIRRVNYIFLILIIFLTQSLNAIALSKTEDLRNPNSSTLDSLIIFYSGSNTLTADDASDHLQLLHKHIEKLRKRLGDKESSAYFLKTLFYKTHKRFLKNYEDVVSYDRLILKGEYNCISGTALFAVIFRSLDIPFSIYESDDHVFLMVYSGKRRYLIESTDPLNGFIADNSVISAHVKNVANGPSDLLLNNVGSSNGLAEGSPGVKELTGLTSLAGLQYYNEAVILYRKGQLSEAYSLALRGYQFYPSGRLRLCLDTILDTIIKCERVPKKVKSRFIEQYSALVISQ